MLGRVLIVKHSSLAIGSMLCNHAYLTLRLFPALPNAGGCFSSNDKNWILQEVEKGLRRHKAEVRVRYRESGFL